MIPSVLVGIVTRNRAGILPKAIASALAQQWAPLKVAVVDDGSTDDTAQLEGQFPEVAWQRWESNRGLIVARNELMARPSFDYYLSLDDDAWFIRGDEVAVAVDYLEQHPRVAAVAYDILSPDRPHQVARTDPNAAAVFIGCGHVLRLSAAREVGFYESVPGSYGGEEKDLCLRLMDAGYGIVSLPGVHVWHDKTAVARVIPAQHRSGVCNDLVMTLRRTPLSLLPVALLAKFYRHSMFSWRNNLLRPCLSGFGLFFQNVPVVWRSRKPVRASTLRTYIQLSRA